MELHTAMSALQIVAGLVLVGVVGVAFWPMVRDRRRQRDAENMDEYLRRCDPDYDPNDNRYF